MSLAVQPIGPHAAQRVRDGGTLQIGIGSVGDAVTNALILHHKKNATFKNLIQRLKSGYSPELSHNFPFEDGI
ncbi:hypothetical protein [Nitrosomonas aestuarii]|uniref:hypothetical protein n=1 Tax=Nitrosomonas aestuarii TaxID=52441 RepID=UPI000D31966B|nr:hypothetical protein [Nitrosomonas aestuarii]